MKGMLKNALIALGVMVALSACFAVGAHYDPALHDLGTAVCPVLGFATLFILQMRTLREQFQSCGSPEQARIDRGISLADRSTLDRALAFDCPLDESLLYIARTGFIGKGLSIEILVDGQPAACLQSPRFTCLPLTPGRHVVAWKVGDGTSSLVPLPGNTSVNLVAGTATVLNLNLDMSFARNTATIVFLPWSMEAAKSKLAGMKMVLPLAPAARPQTG